MKILITGGSGFIGSNAAYKYLKEGHHVHVIDNLSRPNVTNNLIWLYDNGLKKFSKKDIGNVEKKEVRGLDVVFHFAGQVGVQQSIKNPLGDFGDNAMGTLLLLESIRHYSTKPLFVFASTNKVYGHIKSPPEGTSETQPLSFVTPYGCSKGCADQYVLDYCRMYDIPTVVLRMSCIYGNRQFGTEEQGWLAHFMFSKHLGNQVTVYGTGEQVRDVLYISDYLNLLDKLIENKDKVKGEAFNVGGGPDNTISVNGALDSMGVKNRKYSKWRPGDQEVYISNIDKITSYTGWKPQVPVDEGLKLLEKWVSQAYQ